MLDTIQWIALLGFFIVGAIFVAEGRRWHTLAYMISRRQKFIRVCLIVLIEVLFVLMFLGPWVTNQRNPVTAVVYWSTCVLLALAVMILSVVDLRQVMRNYASLTCEMFGELRGQERKDQ